MSSSPKMGFSPPQVTRPISYAPGPKGFFQWLSYRAPQLHARAQPYLRGNVSHLSGLGLTDPASGADIATAAESTSPTSNKIVDTISSILKGVSQAYLTSEQLKAQKKVLDLNLARMQAGQPPLDIDMSKYGAVPQVQVGLSDSTKTLLIVGGVGLALLFVLKR